MSKELKPVPISAATERIMRAMFRPAPGRLRYWLYSIRMSKVITEIVQKDADVLWWAREPTLEEEMNRAGAEAWDKCSTTQGELVEKNKKRITWGGSE